ncbi:hypothetical protein FRC12_006862 [Ceratobasidium sp. 428]|nr:hypothetical protein FRC12_006862 [Ceratobasidium sp. 428]
MKGKQKRPGPAGTSCLTCRRRRKKCDKSRPTCERCAVGGFACLGYDNLDKDAADAFLGDLEDAKDLRSAHTYGSTRSLRPLLPRTKPESLSPLSGPSSAASACDTGSEASDLSRLSTPELFAALSPFDYRNSASTYSYNMLDTYGSQPAWKARGSNLVQPANNSVSMIIDGRSVQSQSLSPIIDLQRSLNSLVLPCATSSPRSLIPVSKDSAGEVNFIILQYERLLGLSFLTPTATQYSHISEVMGWHLQHTDEERWAQYLGCKIFECVVGGMGQRKLRHYVQGVQDLDCQLRSASNQGLTSAEAYNRLAAILELSFLRMMYNDGADAYQILHDTAPIFLQLVLADPLLWLDPTNLVSLSLGHVLNSQHYELSRFVLLDTLYSMAYGLPQVIEYDTSTPPFGSDPQPVEWIHGLPVALKIILVELNKRCSGRNRVAPEPDWQPIEHSIKSWAPITQFPPSKKSWKAAAMLAVHESWRHTLLIYLYMGVCKLRSDDSRVQASVRQVFQLTNSVKEFERPLIDIHFLAQYLVAGACARSETQRNTARDKLEATSHDGLWVVRGCDFVPVLDHLWHGVASNGRPIYWSDYIHSRQIAHPLPLNAYEA